MQIFHNKWTLAPYRERKLLADLQLCASNITAIVTYQLYMVDSEKSFSGKEQQAVLDILQASFGQPAIHENFIIVVPRIGTISPWSTKATDIAHACELNHIKRIERGWLYRFIVDDDQSIDEQSLTAIADLLHDRMTESVLFDGAELDDLFQQQAPEPLQSIDILNDNKALEKANQALGLAFSQDDMSYLTQ